MPATPPKAARGGRPPLPKEEEVGVRKSHVKNKEVNSQGSLGLPLRLDSSSPDTSTQRGGLRGGTVPVDIAQAATVAACRRESEVATNSWPLTSPRERVDSRSTGLKMYELRHWVLDWALCSSWLSPSWDAAIVLVDADESRQDDESKRHLTMFFLDPAQLLADIKADEKEVALEDDDDTESKIEEETETILLGSSGPKPAYTSAPRQRDSVGASELAASLR
eukprot:g11257.t1